MLSSKIDRKALIFLKKIAKKDRKNKKQSSDSKAEGGGEVRTQSWTRSPDKKGSSEHPEENGTGQVVAQVEEVVTMETGDYHDYGDMMETSEDVEARIKQIVKDETAAPVCSDSVSMNPDVVTIAPKRGQVHRLVGRCPELATDACDLCGYRSSKEGVLRHKQRRHPKTVYKCQVCYAGFGVRYDMRRHRLNHFTPTGQLNKRGQRLWVKNHPEVDPDLVHYRDFEENFVSQIQSDTEASDHDTMNKRHGSVNENFVSLNGSDSESPDSTAHRTGIEIEKNIIINKVPRDTDIEIQKYDENFVSQNRAENRDSASIIDGSTESKTHGQFDTTRTDGEILGKSIDGRTDQLQRNISENDSIMTDCTIDTKSKGESSDLEVIRQGEPTGNETAEENVEIPAATEKLKSCTVPVSTDHLETTRKSKQMRKKISPRYPPKDTSRADCPVCGKNFPQKVLAVHMKIHTEKLPMVCPYCAVEFTERSKMNVHIRAKHLRDYTCRLCGKVLGSSTGLKYHIQGAHGDKVVCLICQKKLSNQQSLYIHMKREHGNHWKHTCSQCGKKFFDRRSLQYHSVSHLDSDVQEEKKEYACSVCGKRFLRKQTLMLHQNTHVGMKPFRCDQCDKRFAFGSLLRKHMKVHSELREFPCPHCHKAFKFACKLKYHLIIHTKERKHVCSNCDKIFTTSTALRRHVCKSRRNYKSPVKFAFRPPPELYSSHLEPLQEIQPPPPPQPPDSDTVYVCGVCNLAFLYLDDVNAHVQTHEDVTVVIEDSAATYMTGNAQRQEMVINSGDFMDSDVVTYVTEADYVNEESIVNIQENVVESNVVTSVSENVDNKSMVVNSQEDRIGSNMLTYVMENGNVKDSVVDSNLVTYVTEDVEQQGINIGNPQEQAEIELCVVTETDSLK